MDGAGYYLLDFSTTFWAASLAWSTADLRTKGEVAKARVRMRGRVRAVRVRVNDMVMGDELCGLDA